VPYASYAPDCREHLIFLCFLWHWHHGWCSIRSTCNERCINRVHLTFSLYTNCQNRPCGKEFNRGCCFQMGNTSFVRMKSFIFLYNIYIYIYYI
jgi:hypothetical protein